MYGNEKSEGEGSWDGGERESQSENSHKLQEVTGLGCISCILGKIMSFLYVHLSLDICSS